MAKTKKGQKYNRIPAHKRKLANGKVITIPAHVRSNPTKKCKKKH